MLFRSQGHRKQAKLNFRDMWSRLQGLDTWLSHSIVARARLLPPDHRRKKESCFHWNWHVVPNASSDQDVYIIQSW